MNARDEERIRGLNAPMTPTLLDQPGAASSTASHGCIDVCTIARKIIDEKSYVLEFVITVTPAKEAIFVYLLMPADYRSTFKQKLATESLDLTEHGVVVASGMGHTPSKEVKDYVLSRFPNARV